MNDRNIFQNAIISLCSFADINYFLYSLVFFVGSFFSNLFYIGFQGTNAHGIHTFLFYLLITLIFFNIYVFFKYVDFHNIVETEEKNIKEFNNTFKIVIERRIAEKELGSVSQIEKFREDLIEVYTDEFLKIFSKSVKLAPFFKYKEVYFKYATMMENFLYEKIKEKRNNYFRNNKDKSSNNYEKEENTQQYNYKYKSFNTQSYNILFGKEELNVEIIKTQYKILAKKYHPDINKNAEAEEKFKEINNAYRELLEFYK